MRINFSPQIKTNLFYKTPKFSGKYNQQENDYEKFRPAPVQLSKGQSYNATGSVFISHTTELFRDDLDFEKFGNYLYERFKDENKVNTYVYGCSYGHEAYSLNILFQSLFEKPDKFYPIIAKDVDENIVETAKQMQEKSRVYINGKEFKHISELTYKWGVNKSKFCSCVGINQIGANPKYSERAKLRRNVLNNVIFSQANLLEDINSIDSKNPSIISSRNMWCYINQDEYENAAKALYEKLADKSIVVLGRCDMYSKTGLSDNPISKALIKAGFKQSECKIGTYYEAPYLIYEKNEK